MDKSELTIGTAVRLIGEDAQRAVDHLGSAEDLIIADLYRRVRYDRPTMVAVKRRGHGLALGVRLSSVVAS